MAWLSRVLIVVVASLAIGCLESFAQDFLPHAVKPLSNSASGWALVTVLVVFWSRATTRMAAVLGAVSFVLLVVGYAVVSALRGYPYSPVLWGGVGIIAGPFVGVAASWLRATDVRAGLGGGLLAGIGLGDALYGLITISDTTGSAYWIAIGVASLVLLAVMLFRGVRSVRSIAVLGGVAILTALLLVAAFRVM